MQGPSRRRTRVFRALTIPALAWLLAACGPLRREPVVADRGLPRALPSPRTSRQTLTLPGAYEVEYRFQTFDGEPLQVRFTIDKSTFEAEERDWGYRDADLVALQADRDAARRSAYQAASADGQTQSQLDRALAAVQDGYKRKLHEYIAARGFELQAGDTVQADLPALVRRDAPLVSSLAREIERRARERGRGLAWMISAATSLVQSAIVYREVPSFVDGRHTGGVWAPAKTLLLGWGDCDTKVALLGAILANWPTPRMIIMELPDHFLLGLARRPAKGQSYVDWNGSRWQLIEAAGPAWLPPGYLGAGTKAMLRSGRPYTVFAIQ